MSKKSILKQFGDNAPSYAVSKVHAQGGSLNRLVELLGPQPDWRVLDIATGAGHTALTFAPHVAQVLATDITPEMLEQVELLVEEQDLDNVLIETADAQDLPYPEHSFHLVTCRIAAHHFSDIPGFVQESTRVLKPGGQLAIVDNIVPDGPVGDYINAFGKLHDPSHGRCLSILEWLEIAEAAGLSLVHQETIAKQMDFDFWAQRHDENGLRYLKSMLTQGNAGVQEFLKPAVADRRTHFQLIEGIFIFQA